MFVDSGAAGAGAGKSLPPAGVTRIEGVFARGDCVAIRNEHGTEIGRGLIAYDAAHAERIRGRNSRDIAHILGTGGWPVLNCHSEWPVRASTASKAPVSFPKKTKFPAVVSVPPQELPFPTCG